jgi:hypothetical protein
VRASQRFFGRDRALENYYSPMTNFEGWILVACIGGSPACSSAPPSSGVDSSVVVDAADSIRDGAALEPGVYATIASGPFAGTYALTHTVECNYDSDARAYRVFASDLDHELEVWTLEPPEAGQTKSSPVWAILEDEQVNATFYPQDTGGSCTTTIEHSFPVTRLRFSCTGGAFAVTDGIAVCPG